MDLEAALNQLETLLADARPVPLSASVMISRRDFEEVLAEMRAGMPEELRQSRWVLKERDELLAQAAREADQVLADARDERDRMLSETEVVKAARREAERILEEAREQARAMRMEAEDYIDGKLATFEIVLSKTMATVERGRERLRGRLTTDELAEPLPDLDAGAGGAPAEGGGSQLYDYEANAAGPGETRDGPGPPGGRPGAARGAPGAPRTRSSSGRRAPAGARHGAAGCATVAGRPAQRGIAPACPARTTPRRRRCTPRRPRPPARAGPDAPP